MRYRLTFLVFVLLAGMFHSYSQISKGSYEYISQSQPDQKFWSTKGVDLLFDKEGHCVIKVSFDKAEAKIIFFGVSKK